ncbi:hypothetical protein CsSME_00031419 [Camellia sinensis var. sinensis]
MYIEQNPFKIANPLTKLTQLREKKKQRGVGFENTEVMHRILNTNYFRKKP